ncbi:histidinolphosphatase [Xylographa soralifera]|nr:histidinolphosphatase [Xylographa soralifera]
MPFSHHSHSGQFCLHAKDSLEAVVKTAISKGMETLVLTEHMPRDQETDLYPEEIEAGKTTDSLLETFDEYYKEARRLQSSYSLQIDILVGVETDWIRPSSKQVIGSLSKKYGFDTVIGSVHHVHSIPTDFDRETYEKARDISGGTDEKLYADYYDAQLKMLEAVKPPIVGHFDVIRLLSDNPNASMKKHDAVWSRISRNLSFISSYGGMLEVNSAALRKGMSEPYPQGEICQEFSKMNGDFVLSDDSHGVSQVGFGFKRTVEFVEEIGVKTLIVLTRGLVTRDARFPGVSGRPVPVKDLEKNHAFFQAQRTVADSSSCELHTRIIHRRIPGG